MSDATLRNYLRQIEGIYHEEDATEHSYRAKIQELLKSLDINLTVTNEPRRRVCGAPDLIVTKNQTPLGYIETKDIGVSLDKAEQSKQMKRYLGSLTNLILTDYIDFRWYVEGDLRMTARLAKISKPLRKLVLDTDGIAQVGNLLQGFIMTDTPTINSPKELALRMARLAQLIRSSIFKAYQMEEKSDSFHAQMEGFREVLLPAITPESFADMYAQTICYGLFAARCNAKPNEVFTRERASYDIPKTNPFLRKMFGYIAGPELDERITWVVDDLAQLLYRADMQTILRDIGKRIRNEDPIVHFYETFLAHYDPELRELRGVYYTPEPVVSYIVRSADYILKHDFDLSQGLADNTKIVEYSSDGKHSLEAHKVQILDPAIGTGTFLYYVIKQIYAQFTKNRGMWSSYVSQHLLPRLFGFELLMAPYAVAHLKLGLQLKETGYDFRSNERLGVYLTNTLEAEFEVSKVWFADWLEEEAAAAGNIKYDAPVMVVLGNPPYSYDSLNKSPWISSLIRDYFQVDGKSLGERNPKGLQDDYVKFIRFAQWRIERTGYGILAFITNHGFLDNPTFRGMRQSLLKSFDDIYVLDLHGNSKKRERSPDGTKDENVFDIQQGVAISILVKREYNSTSSPATVHHAHLWGVREVRESITQEHTLIGGKYQWLEANDVSSTVWTTLSPQSPFYFFIPQDTTLLPEYEQGFKVTDIFPINGAGFYTARDSLTIQWTKDDVWKTLNDFASLPTEVAREKYALGPDTRDWQVKLAQKDIKATGPIKSKITSVAYRPFDVRYTYYTGKSRGIICMPRESLMQHMLNKSNVGLITSRQQSQPGEWRLAGVSKWVTECCAISNKTKEMNYLFPLYLYKNTDIWIYEDQSSSMAANERTPNIAPGFISYVSTKLELSFVNDGAGDLQKTFGPEDILSYCYAILYAESYRTRYAEFLRNDFPRIPITSSIELFHQLCIIGNRLVKLHLMERIGRNRPEYPEDGEHKVERVEYLAPSDNQEQGQVWINKIEYFDGVPPEVWEFHLAGYQVLFKWLKDRKGRKLSYDDIEHYQQIVAALTETVSLMEQIDEAIEEHGGWPIE